MMDEFDQAAAGPSVKNEIIPQSIEELTLLWKQVTQNINTKTESFPPDMTCEEGRHCPTEKVILRSGTGPTGRNNRKGSQSQRGKFKKQQDWRVLIVCQTHQTEI